MSGADQKTPTTDTTDRPGPGPTRPVSPSLAFALSIFPGVGHLYLGLMNTGIFLMLLFLSILIIPTELAPFAIVIVFYSAFDALRLARAANEKETLSDMDLTQVGAGRLPRNWATLALGAALVFMGAVFLARNLGYYLPTHLIWPFLPMGLGLWLIINYFRNDERN